jgi:hypothetical protein
LDNLADDNDILADVRVEVGAGDARVGDCFHGGVVATCSFLLPPCSG